MYPTLANEKILKRRDLLLLEYGKKAPEIAIVDMAEQLARKELSTAGALQTQGEDFYTRISGLVDALENRGCKKCVGVVHNTFNPELQIGSEIRKKDVRDVLHTVQARLQLILTKGKDRVAAMQILEGLLDDTERRVR